MFGAEKEQDNHVLQRRFHPAEKTCGHVPTDDKTLVTVQSELLAHLRIDPSSKVPDLARLIA